ncbi:early nodulin-like protein 2 [Lactuca sativa]|uniref:Phytocyanin domain-containing protein n=1 Tax=Lactuca sativa TaxID=4236 RepID=A0A9R1UET2_LACSA|nr:early nodulin-like protein 2 [Lactuca sativa]KAJ0185738.1 hypothetical protein LSAT_V11C900495550 [Lactuca sativa]
MASQISLWFLVALFITFICSSQAATLEVGEDDGWTLNPAESYAAWAGRLRFMVNDTLHFKYDDATDSVLVVDKDDYDSCNVDDPIEKLDGGDTNYRLEHGGPNYFITGNKSNCEQGQKVDVVVLHIRTQSPPSPPPAPAPLPPAPASPVTPPPTATPVLTPPASAPTGGSSATPVASNPADLNPPPPTPAPSATPSSATAVVSGTITASLVTMIIALCLIN